MIENIRKRDGRLVPFELDKIAGAIYKAFQACSSKYELKTALDIAKKVEKNLEKINIAAASIIENTHTMSSAVDKTVLL